MFMYYFIFVVGVWQERWNGDEHVPGHRSINRKLWVVIHNLMMGNLYCNQTNFNLALLEHLYDKYQVIV